MKLFLPFLLLLGLGGCTFGPSQQDYAEHLRPAGSQVTFECSGCYVGDDQLSTYFVAELIEVREKGMVVFIPVVFDERSLVQHRLAVVPYALSETMTVRGRGDLDEVSLRGGKAPGGGEFERLQRLSRYPYGLTPKAQDRLLAGLGQDSLYQVTAAEEDTP